MKAPIGSPSQRTMPDARRSRHREILLASAVALALAAFLILAVVSLNKEVSGRGVKGRITRMEFIPQPEKQISIGSKGLHMRQTDGIYRLHVTDPATGRDFIVDVDRITYQQQRVGRTFYFVPPPATSPAFTPMQSSPTATPKSAHVPP